MPRVKKLSTGPEPTASSKHQFDGSDNTKYPNNYPIHNYDNDTINVINVSNLNNQLINYDAITKNQYNTSLPVSKDYTCISTAPESAVSRDFVTVYEYKLGNQIIIWDYVIGWVYITSIWKAVGNSKADVLKLVATSPEIKNKVYKTKGGCLKVQGTWIQYDVAKQLATKFCWPIRFALVPIFGVEFVHSCLKMGQPGYGLFQLVVSEKDLNKKRRRKRKSITLVSTISTSPSKKKRKVFYSDDEEGNDENWYPKPKPNVIANRTPIAPPNDLESSSYSEDIDSEPELFDNRHNTIQHIKFIKTSPIQHNTYLSPTSGYVQLSAESTPITHPSSKATSTSSSISYTAGFSIPPYQQHQYPYSPYQIPISMAVPGPLQPPPPHLQQYPYYSPSKPLLAKLESPTMATFRRNSTNTNITNIDTLIHDTGNYIYHQNTLAAARVPPLALHPGSSYSSPQTVTEPALAGSVDSAAKPAGSVDSAAKPAVPRTSSVKKTSPTSVSKSPSLLLDSLLQVVMLEMEELSGR